MSVQIIWCTYCQVGTHSDAACVQDRSVTAWNKALCKMVPEKRAPLLREASLQRQAAGQWVQLELFASAADDGPATVH